MIQMTNFALILRNLRRCIFVKIRILIGEQFYHYSSTVYFAKPVILCGLLIYGFTTKKKEKLTCDNEIL